MKKAFGKIAVHQLGRIVVAILLLEFSAQVCAQEDAVELEQNKALEEITVTVQKREQSVQDIPAAVTAIESTTFVSLGITDIAGIQNLVPSVRLQKESASTEIYIRGVGITLDFPMIEPPNAYNINGVYIPREISSATLMDVERVEVLPGPQGTLYGRGAIGGVINTVIRRPTDTFEANVILEVGNYSHLLTVATLNVPVNDKLAFRGSVSYLNRDGYLETGADSAEDLAGFFALNYTPNDDVSVYLWTHIENKGAEAANLISKGIVGGDPESQAFPNKDPWDDRLVGLIGPLGPYASTGPIDAQDRDWDVAIFGAEINWQINDALSLTYIPSYMDFEWGQRYWVTHKLTDFNENIDQMTHELRFNYDTGGALSWVAGLYYYEMNTDGQIFLELGPNDVFLPDDFFPGSPGSPTVWVDGQDTRDHELSGIAGFGHATWAISDTMRVVFGGRLSRDERKASGLEGLFVEAPDRDNLVPTFFHTGIDPIVTWTNEDEWNNVDWKIGVEKNVLEDSMLYANVQTGFQPGTFRTGARGLDGSVIPSTTTEESQLLAFTAGMKNRFRDGQLLVNGELFFYQYDDLLTNAWDATIGNNRMTNADTDILGFQLDMQMAPDATPDTTFRLSLGYLDAEYDSILPEGGVDYSFAVGNQLQNAPEWTATLGITHDWNLKTGALIRGIINSRYESGFWGDFLHSPGIYQESYTKTNITLTYHATNGGWSLGLWVKNLEDQAVQAAAAPANTRGTDPGPGAVFLEAPRTFGARFTALF